MFKEYNKSKVLLIHILFWIIYYLLFGLIWAKEGKYLDSFCLEFVLLPVRIMSVYLTIYLLIPKYLIEKQFKSFFAAYLLMLLGAGLLQQLFFYLFVENFLLIDATNIYTFNGVVRSIILINTTVVFVSAIYISHLFFIEKSKNDKAIGDNLLALKSNKRTYTVKENEIVHIDGLGNYVTFHLQDATSIIVYDSLKNITKNLSENFVRIHKSHIVNKSFIKSFSKENIETKTGVFVPIGKSFEFN